jgi:hypothetical protein
MMATDIRNILPLPNGEIREESELSDWIDGNIKPAIDGLYLREFDEGEATSEFHEGEWLIDGFFASDIQDARWRGLRTPS